MVGALVAGPLLGPVLLSIIALIGQKGEVALGALLMVVFSIGMGLIFLAAERSRRRSCDPARGWTR
jgi:cytochrome c biogenesis protein CcdA